MSLQNSNKSYKNSSSKMFGRQKVKLYKIRHIIFDFGGVMSERSFVLKNLLDSIESDLKIKIPRIDNPYIKKLKRKLSSGRLTSREFLEKISDRYYYPYQKHNGALPAKKVNLDYYLELWFELHTKLTKLSSDMKNIVETFHSAGYTVSLMSNVYDVYAKSNELRGFYDSFDYVFLSNEIGLIKPKIDKYKYVLKKLDAKAKQVIYIDDKIQNLVPARKLGMIVVNFESFKKFKQQLDCIGLKEISKSYRQEINEKYKVYKMKNKQYKKAKKAYKKAKKKLLKKKGKSAKISTELEQKREEFYKIKLEFKKEKEIKKHELILKCELD
ncbi:MAG: HAD-IA family hydrolase [Candidatus Hodarchaeota archaeon]